MVLLVRCDDVRGCEPFRLKMSDVCIIAWYHQVSSKRCFQFVCRSHVGLCGFLRPPPNKIERGPNEEDPETNASDYGTCILSSRKACACTAMEYIASGRISLLIYTWIHPSVIP